MSKGCGKIMRSEQPHEITDAAIEGIAAMQTIALCKEDIKNITEN